jgi:myo-inositol-1(or 4)-monophosphatase
VIKSWDALGAIAVCEGAGATVSDFLSDDGLFKGNSLIAAAPGAYAEIEAVVRG